MRARLPSVGLAGAVTGGTGLVLVATGTFLPWFRSGEVLRDSYQSISIVRTIRVLDGNPLSLALDAWTMIVPLITVCVIAYTFGFHRTAATIGTIIAIICGTVGGAAAVESGSADTSVGIAGTGPTVMLIGGVLALLGAVGIFAGRRAQASAVAGGEP